MNSTCFKYRPINKRLIESIVSPHVYCAQADSLNDPFDCRIDLRGSFERAAARASEPRRKEMLQAGLKHGQQFFDNLEQGFKKLGICSLSLDAENTLMWSHYADEHRGVCLAYRFPHEVVSKIPGVIGMDAVSYADDVLTSWLANLVPLEQKAFHEELIKVCLVAKAEAWKYEREVRLIVNNPGKVELPTGSLVQICFGLHTSPDDEALIRKLATEHAGCKGFTRIVRWPSSDFGLRMVGA